VSQRVNKTNHSQASRVGLADRQFVVGLYTSEEEKKKAELVSRPFTLLGPEAGGNGPTPGLKKEGDARSARISI
jgi:hypothetical protein